MTGDRDAFVFYSALVIAVLSLFIGHEGTHDTMASAASAVVRAAPVLDAATPQQVRGGGQSLVLAVSEKTH